MRIALQGISNKVIQKAGLAEIRSGDILLIKIIENKKGLIKASLSGKLIQLKGSAELKPGQNLKVRAMWSGKGNILYLNKADAQAAFSKKITDLGIKPDLISTSLFEAARRAGLPLKDDNIRLIKRLLRLKSKLSREEARVAVECLKKGLSAEEITGIINNQFNHDRRKEEKTLLFNSLMCQNELWFIIPYSFSSEELVLEGSIRIKKNTKTRVIETVVLETSFKNGRLYFIIENYGKDNRRLKLAADRMLNNNEKHEIKRLLPEILGNLSLKFDDNIIDDCFKNSHENILFDGFSTYKRSANSIEAFV